MSETDTKITLEVAEPNDDEFAAQVRQAATDLNNLLYEAAKRYISVAINLIQTSTTISDVDYPQVHVGSIWKAIGKPLIFVPKR